MLNYLILGMLSKDTPLPLCNLGLGSDNINDVSSELFGCVGHVGSSSDSSGRAFALSQGCKVARITRYVSVSIPRTLGNNDKKDQHTEEHNSPRHSLSPPL